MNQPIAAFVRASFITDAVFNEGSSAAAIAHMAQIGLLKLTTTELELDTLMQVLAKEGDRSENLIALIKQYINCVKIEVQKTPGQDIFMQVKNDFPDVLDPEDVAIIAGAIGCEASIILSDRNKEWYPQETSKPILCEMECGRFKEKALASISLPFLNLRSPGAYLYRETDALIYGKTDPWVSLNPQDYLRSCNTLGGAELEWILNSLERWGFCMIRLQGQGADKKLLQALESFLGPACESQNNVKGKIKEINPDEAKAANTGDSAKALAFHTDGTQQPELPPAILAFQYLTTQTFGGLSTFLDLTELLLELPSSERLEILTALAQPDAAKSEKKGMLYEGPLVVPVCAGNSLSFRLRFDDVMVVNPKYLEQFEKLKQRILRRSSYLSYSPQEGDIVIFDNWRVMHGRQSLEGTRHLRFHNRMWIDKLDSKHSGRYLGVRGFSTRELAAIERASQGASIIG